VLPGIGLAGIANKRGYLRAANSAQSSLPIQPRPFSNICAGIHAGSFAAPFAGTRAGG